MVGIVVVSHSPELARGVVDLAGELAGPEVSLVAVGGGPDGRLGTDGERVREAIARVDAGDGVILLGDLGSAILTIRHVLERRANNHARLVDAPLVEGTLAAAVCASAGMDLEDVAKAAEEARNARKL
jgi:phosphoenolpyruvate---glycerone phosphotransferase subunit DhaM